MGLLCRNNFIGVIMDFIKARLKERTSLDGAMLIGGGIMMILAPVNLIAYGMIAYGAWTLYKKED
jgi:hypothetical protein